MNDKRNAVAVRLILGVGFMCVAGYLAWAFTTAPYELIQVCTTRAQPDGTGLFIGAFFAGLAALVAFLAPAGWS